MGSRCPLSPYPNSAELITPQCIKYKTWSPAFVEPFIVLHFLLSEKYLVPVDGAPPFNIFMELSFPGFLEKFLELEKYMQSRDVTPPPPPVSAPPPPPPGTTSGKAANAQGGQGAVPGTEGADTGTSARAGTSGGGKTKKGGRTKKRGNKKK
jgi:hypothetical protein